MGSIIEAPQKPKRGHVTQPGEKQGQLPREAAPGQILWVSRREPGKRRYYRVGRQVRNSEVWAKTTYCVATVSWGKKSFTHIISYPHNPVQSRDYYSYFTNEESET